MRPSTERDHLERIRRVQTFMELHLDAPLAIDSLAQLAALSLHHFHRVFRGVVGESVEAHVRRLRLERAARSLRANGVRIADVANGAGYRSHEAFTRAFIEHFGQSPSDYRKRPGRRARRMSEALLPLPEVRVARYPAIPVVSLRHVGDWDLAPRTFRQLARWSKQCGVRGAMHCLVPDDPDITPQDKLRLDACVECTRDVPRAPGMHAQVIPQGLYAVAIHRGPWTQLTVTYDALIGGWLPTTHYRPAPEPIVETYLDGAEVPESERRTEVRIRLAD
ncbi:MAG TPA: GyrI-like domain-containing protein [Polyangiales bacterium]|nr:GyrI-like domain-containing protein [Polyangiales bacterium]